MNAGLARVALLLAGAWADLRSGIEAVDWSFAAGGLPLLAVGTILALVLAALCYVRTTEGLTVGMRITLGLLRFVALASLLVIAAGTVCRIHVVRQAKPELLALVDDSPSMSLPDATGGVTRLTVAESAAKADILSRFIGSFDIRTVHTSEALGTTGAGEQPQSLAAAVVRAASADTPRWPPAHVLLLSDGIQIGGAELEEAARLVGVPVSAVALGRGAGIRDLLIRGATVPPFAYLADHVLVTADVRSHGIEGETVLRLMRLDGKTEREVTSVKVTAKPDGSPMPVRVEFVADQAGLQRYALLLGPAAGELTEANNVLHFYLDVRDEKIRVLFVEGQPGWEYRFAKAALESDPAVTFHGSLRLPPDEWFYQGPPKRDDGTAAVLHNPRGGFPDTLDELAYFDVVLLGDVERKTFEEAKRFDVVDLYVRERGGGLGTIGGMTVYSAGHYEDTPLARLLPFRLSNEKKTELVNRFQVKLTPQGLMHPVMQLEADPARNAEAWAGLPWVEGGNAISRVKPSAVELLVHPTLSTKYGPRPIAAAWECGRGRVYSTALDGTWHWSTARKTEADYHKRYWGLLVRWLAGDPRVQRSNALVLETPVCEAGKPLTVSLSLRNASGLPIADAEVVFSLSLPGHANVTARLISDPANPGRYALTVVPDAAGDGRISGECRFADGATLKRELKLTVDPSREEFLKVGPDEEGLRALAAATGGTVQPIDRLQALRIPPAPPIRQAASVRIELWHAPGLAIVLFACLMLEWAYRKRRGLA